MARIREDGFTPKIRGKLGAVIYKWYGNKCVVQKLPARRKRRQTPRLKASHANMAAASVYADRVQVDPEAFAFYQTHARKRRITVRSLAMSDFMRDPAVSFSAVAYVTGRIGDTVWVDTEDLFRVTSVQVSICDAGGRLMESGMAARRKKAFTYSLQNGYAQGQCITIEAVARTRAGRRVALAETLTLPAR